MKVRINETMFKVMIGILAAVFLFAAVLLGLSLWERSREADWDGYRNVRSLSYNGKEYTQREDLDTVLVMGLDKFGATEDPDQYRNNQQSDFMMLLVVDRDAKTYSALHLNRDTMTEIPILGVTGSKAGSFEGQLALAHTYGTGGKDSCRNAVEAVENLLHGVTIDHYVSMTMDAVAELNDLAGGVKVEILDDFSGIDPDLIKGQTVTLQGQQALTYVRTRKGMEDSSNLRRMERQRQYLTALREQVEKKNQEDPNFSAKAMNRVANYLISDCTGNQLSLMSQRLADYTFVEVEALSGKAVKGEEFMEFYVDEDSLMETVIRMFFE